MIYIISEKIIFWTRTIAICNNMNEVALTINDKKFLKRLKGELEIKKVIL